MSRRGMLTLEALEQREVPDAAANRAFLDQAYQDLLLRAADPGGREFYAAGLDQNKLTRPQAALALVTSPESRTLQVAGLYSYYLHRPADAGQGGFVQALLTGARTEDIEARIIGSPEYFTNRGGGTVPGFIDAIYTDVLGRLPDPSGQATFTDALNRGVPRTVIATALLNSNEHQAQLVQGLYNRLLGRGADAGGLTSFVLALQRGFRQEHVIAALVGSDEYYFRLAPTTSTFSPVEVLTESEVSQLLQRAAAATASEDAIIAITDRGGNLLGLRVEGGVSPAITGNNAQLVFAADGAISLARTGAFFGNNQAPLTSRTIRNLSQSTITQREVESNPNITDPNSPLRGPGFVAPISIGGHFPPNVMFTPPVDLFSIEHTNRDSIKHPGPDHIKGTADDILLPNRFNVPDAFINPVIPAEQRLTPPESYGRISGLMPDAQSRGIATLPGGIPIFKNGVEVGGIGVFFPGTTGFASEENSVLGAEHNPAKPDRSLEAEYIAFAALGGSAGAGFSIGTLGGVAPVPGISLPFGRIDLVGITLDIYGPGGIQGPQNLVSYARRFAQGNPNSGTNYPVTPGGDDLIPGQPVPEGWLVLPHAGGGLSAEDVRRLVEQGVAQAERTRAAIRLPLGSRSRMVISVTDTDGNVLGLYRMPDATVFSIDVAVAKARNVAYYADPTTLQPPDRIAGIPPGVAFTNRTFRYVAQPRYPSGIDGTPPGPFSILLDGGSDPLTGRTIGAPLPASAFQSVQGYDAFNPGTNFRDPNNVANQNGIVFFPGSSPLYKDTNGDGIAELVGGYGISGDGVDQDDVVTFVGSTGYATPLTVLRADQVRVRDVRLPYIKFNRNPEA